MISSSDFCYFSTRFLIPVKLALESWLELLPPFHFKIGFFKRSVELPKYILGWEFLRNAIFAAFLQSNARGFHQNASLCIYQIILQNFFLHRYFFCNLDLANNLYVHLFKSSDFFCLVTWVHLHYSIDNERMPYSFRFLLWYNKKGVVFTIVLHAIQQFRITHDFKCQYFLNCSENETHGDCKLQVIHTHSDKYFWLWSPCNFLK